MSSVLERATAHFSDQGRKSISVPEWGEEGKPLVIYYTPLTVAERRRIMKPGQRDQADPNIAVDALIEKALDENGNKLFTLDDREALLRGVDGNVVDRVAAEIIRGGPDAGDTEKN